MTTYQSVNLWNRLSASRDGRSKRSVRGRTSSFGRNHLAGRAIDYSTFYLAAGLRMLQLVREGDILIAATDGPGE